jgi:type I restriction enzyme S subunit
MAQVAKLKTLFAEDRQPINPLDYLHETFALYSIPAYDTGKPELVSGKQVGSSKVLLKDQDVLLSRIVPHIRRCWIVNGTEDHRRIGSGEWIVFRVPKNVDPKYLRYFFLTEKFGKKFMQTVRGVGGSLLRADPKQVGEFEIPLPPLPIQKKIAAILDKADSLRQKDKQLLEYYNKLAQSIFYDMFGDPTVNPKKWPLRNLNEIGTLERGVSKHRPRNAPELLGGPYPLIQTGDIANADVYITSFSSSYSEIGLAQSKLWPKGTLCITIAANIGKTAITTFDSCFPDSVVGFKSNEYSNPIFVKFWFNHIQSALEEFAPEAAQKNINLEILRGLKVPTPPLSGQNQFAQKIGKVEGMKRETKSSIKNSETLFLTLLQKAFKGELVKES